MTRTVTLAALAALGLGCPQTAPPDYQHIQVDTAAMLDASGLGAGDLFEIRIHQHPELSGMHRVSPEGEIDVPLVGRLNVRGMTSSQIASLVQERLRDGYLNNPFVTVVVKEFNSKKVFVLGQVAKPGTFPYEDNLSIVQAIALAGGFTPLAEKNYAIVQRVDQGVEKRIPVPVERIMTDQDAKNFFLKPGDVVFVPEAVL